MKNRKRSFTPKSRYADLRSDFMIKRIFSQEDILLSFLNVIIPDKHFTGIRFNHTERFGDRKIISIINFNLFKLDDNRFLYSFHLKEDKSNLI